MTKVNLKDLEEIHWSSPGGKYSGAGKQVSEALGRDPTSTDLLKRHPFDVEVSRIPPGKSPCPYHSHSAQWEYFQVLSGRGSVRSEAGAFPIGPNDAFLFKPGEPHQLISEGPDDLVVLIVADNPLGESCHYPDSGKWLVRSPERKIIRSEGLDYYLGEE